MKKFENSRNLKKHIEKIRKTYMKEMKSKEKKIRQRATALWVIDHLVWSFPFVWVEYLTKNMIAGFACG